MQLNSKSVLEGILTIIQYEDDKEAFITSFLTIVQDKTFLELFRVLPKEKQETFTKKKDPQSLAVVIQENISEEVIKTQLNETFTATLNEYVAKILPTLSKDQMRKLDAYFSSLLPQGKKSHVW